MRAALFFMAFWSCATRVCADTSLLPPGPLCGPGVFSSSAESAARLMRAQTTRQHPPVNRTLTEQHRRAPAATRPIALLPAIRDEQGARDAASARAQSILAARGSRHAGLPCGRSMRLVRVEANLNYTNLDLWSYVCECGETVNNSVAHRG